MVSNHMVLFYSSHNTWQSHVTSIVLSGKIEGDSARRVVYSGRWFVYLGSFTFIFRSLVRGSWFVYVACHVDRLI